jgi:conjugal transfer mating pair stabilization protein TraG
MEIITYWNVETLYQFFNGVAAIVGGSDFSAALRIMVVLALGLSVFAWWKQRLYEWSSDKIMLLVLIALFTTVKSDVLITDKTNLEPPRTVANVPWVLAASVFVTNGIGTWMVYKYETVFNIPTELSLATGDMAFGHRILKNVNRAKLVDAPLQADLMQFIKECTLNDVRDGVITEADLLKGVDSWNVMWDNTSPARFVTVGMLTDNQNVVTCTDAAKNAGALTLKARVEQATTAAMTYYGRNMFPRSSSDAIAASLFASAIGSSYSYILGVTANASDALRQSMFNNLWKDAGTTLPAMLSDPARVNEVTALMTTAAAARAADGANASNALLTQETIPHVRNVIQAFLLGFFPILVLMMFILNNEERTAYFKTYLKLLAGIELLPVVFAILNHISLIWLTKKAAALKLSTSLGVPFQLSDVFDATIQDEQAMLGSMLIGVMVLLLVLLGATQLSGVIDRVTSVFASAASSTAGELSRGNFSSGSVALDNASANNSSFFKYDSNMSLAGGGASVQMANGSIAGLSPNGAVSYQALQNSFAARISASRSAASDTSTRAGNSVVTTEGQQWTNRDGSSATFNRSVGSRRDRSSNQSTGVNSLLDVGGSMTQSSGQSNSNAVSEGRTSRFAEGESAERSISSQYGGQIGIGGGSVGAPAGASGGAPGSTGGVASGSRSGGRIGGGSRLPISFGVTAQSVGTYSTTASNSRDWNSSQSESGSSNASRGFGYNVRAGIGTSNGVGESSSQTSNESRDASRSTTSEQSRSADRAFREDKAFDENASYNNARSTSIQRDLERDPNFLKKVAQSQGLSVQRMLNRGDAFVYQAMEDYYDKSVATQMQMPSNFNGGVPVQARPSANALRSTGQGFQDTKVLDQVDRTNRGKSGYAGTGKVGANVAPNELIEDARRATVRDSYGPRSVEPPERERGIPIRDIVGESKDIGNNPMSVNGEAESIQGRGLVQGVKNALNTALGKGGVGTPKTGNADNNGATKSPEER